MFDEIVLSRQSWRMGIDPLWKLKLTEFEYKYLIDFVHDKVLQKAPSYQWNREAALLFAEWWKREYVGGPHNKRDIAVFLHLEDYESNLFEAAKEGARRLRIPFIKKINTLYLETLFLQGGLPLGALSKSDGVNRYERYLNTIVKYICSHDVKWESTDFIQSFNSYISQSFHNEVMYDLTLQIARAIYFEDNDFFPFNFEDNSLEQLITSLKKTKKETPRIVREIPFRTQWRIEKTGNELRLFYQIEYENVISKNWVDNNLRNINDPFRTIDLNVNYKSSVQRYTRKINGDYFAKFTNQQISGQFEDFTTSVLSIQLTTNNNRIFDIVIPNCDLPDLQEPTILTLLDNKGDTSIWKIVNNPVGDNLNAVVSSKEWSSENGMDVVFNNEILSWSEFQQAISITNDVSKEELKFDTNFLLDYRVDFGVQMIDWIQKSNYFILTSNPEIKVFDFDEKLINHNQYYVHYRLRGSETWIAYNIKESLPVGLIEIKVHISGQSPIRKKFFHTGQIDYKILQTNTKSGTIQWQWGNGTIVPINMENGLDFESSTVPFRWNIIYNQDFQSFPTTIKFELRSNQDKSTKLVIEVASPFKGVVLIDPSGKVVNNEQSLCANALLGYRCIVMGIDQIPINIQFFKNENDLSPIAEETTQFNQGLENSLLMLELQIKTILRINRHSIFDFFDKSICRIKIGSDLLVKIELFNGDSYNDGKCFRIRDKQNNEIIDFPYPVFAVPVNCEPEEIKVYQLKKQSDESFSFQVEDDHQSEVIIFSQMNASAAIHLRPRYHNIKNILNAEDIPEKTRMELHSGKIFEIKQILSDSDLNQPSWKMVEKYFEIVVANNLPFETFTCFTAISKDKKLMTRMAIILFLRQKTEKARMNDYLNRFESEFATAWHWINKKYWEDAINDILEIENIDGRFHQDYRNELIGRVISLLSFKAIDQDSISQFFIEVFLGTKNLSYVGQPSPAEIQFEKSKYNNGNGIYIPEYVTNSFPVIPNQFRSYYHIDSESLKSWGGLLLSPFFSALAFMGKNEVFNDHNRRTDSRHRILYFMDLDPEWYFYVYEKMVKKIQQGN